MKALTITKAKKVIEWAGTILAGLVVVKGVIEVSHAIISGSKKLRGEVRSLWKSN
jgi:hypothetical protein